MKNQVQIWVVEAVFGLAVSSSQGGLDTEFMFNLNIGSLSLHTVTVLRKAMLSS